MKRAICVLAIGKKYKKMFIESGIAKYAKLCKADLIVIDSPPDKSYKRSLFSQKLLLPEILKGYDEVCYLDLDILISKNAPSIFEEFPDIRSFGAVIDPRGTSEFVKAWREKRIITETTTDYFMQRGFSPSDKGKLIGSINGGVLLFRPKKIWKIFKDYYYSNHSQGTYTAHEEAPMAFLTQDLDLFFPIDRRFNCQLFYKIKGRGLIESRIERLNGTFLVQYINKAFRITTGFNMLPTKSYHICISSLLETNYILHFAGNYPIPKAVKGALY